MVASKTSIIFAAVALGAASTYAVPSFDRNLVMRAPHEESGIADLAPRDVMAAAAAGTSDPTTGGASDIAVTAVSSTSDKAKPGPYKHKDEGYESGEEGHKGVEGHRHHHHHHHHKGHHRHHHHHDDEKLYDAAFEEGFGAGYAAGLIGDMGFQGDQHRHHGHHRHHHHHGYHPHHEESADASAKASVNETVTVETQASLQPTHVKRSFNNIVERGVDDGMSAYPSDASPDASMTMPSPGSGPGGDQDGYQGGKGGKVKKPYCTFPRQKHCRHRHILRHKLKKLKKLLRPRPDGGRRQRQPMQDPNLNTADAGQAQDMTPPSDGSSDADAPPMKRSWKRDLAHGLGLEDEFFMKRAYEEDEFMY